MNDERKQEPTPQDPAEDPQASPSPQRGSGTEPDDARDANSPEQPQAPGESALDSGR